MTVAELALLYGSGSRKGLIELDAVLSEGHEASADVTEHPVEAGVAISDHVRRKLRTLEIVGVISNTPIVDEKSAGVKEAIAAVKAFESDLAGDAILSRIPIAAGVVGGKLNATIRGRADDARKSRRPIIGADIVNPNAERVSFAWTEIERITGEGILVTVATTLRDYPSMAITSARTTRTSETGDAIEVSLSLKEVVIVSSTKAEIPAEFLKPKNLGRQATKPPPPKVEEQATAAIDNRTEAARLLDASRGK